MKEEQRNRVTAAVLPPLLVGVLGVMTMFLGSVVIVGWHLGEPLIIKLHPSFAAMQYTTACGFLLCGAGLLARLGGLGLVARICGGIVALLGLVLAVEYASNVHLGLWKFLDFLPHPSGESVSKPSPPASVAFFLCGVGICVSACRNRFQWCRLIIWTCSSLALSIGSMALLGYMTGLYGTYHWGPFLGMAAHTSVGVILVSGALMAGLFDRNDSFTEDRWIAVPILLAGLTASYVLFQALVENERSPAMARATVMAKGFAENIQNKIEGPVRALDRMARRWADAGGTPEPQWRNDAARYLEDEPVFSTLAVLSPDFRVKWVMPVSSTSRRTENRWDAASVLKRASEDGSPAASPQLHLDGGGGGFFVYVPLYAEGAADGFLEAAFRDSDIIAAVLAENRFEGYKVAVFDGASRISGDEPGMDAAEATSNFFGRSWKIWVSPETPFSISQAGKLPFLVLSLCVVLSAALAATAQLLQRTRLQSDKIAAANARLTGAAELLEQRAQQLETARTKADENARAKAEFLANMSHEIRTPLNAVIGMSDILACAELEPRDRELADTIKTSGEMLLDLINNILDFSKIESGQLELESAPFRLGECVEQALDVVANSAARKGLDLLYWIDPAVPPYIRGDITRLRQILVNLAANAVKFTERGEIFVKVSPGDTGGRSMIRFEVRDSGEGIPAERMDRLFHAFSQVDASTTRRHGGTGLGLAISHRLVAVMGGQIRVKSEIGKGSQFIFDLPLAPAEISGKPAEEASASSLLGLRVLVVDDNETSRWVLREQTASWGMIPSVARGAEEALEQISGGPVPDVAILDTAMPGMDGFSLAAEIRKTWSPAALPIILLSSIGNEKSAIPHLGIAATLTRPIKFPALFKAIFGLQGEKPREEKTVAAEETGRDFAARYPLSILMAEDNKVNQRVSQLLLQKLGYEVSFAENGREVLARLSGEEFDVILMDVQMPEMDGLETTREIRRTLAPEKRPWIIALTANAIEGDRPDCLAAGMDDYLSKPIRRDHLARALERAHQSRSPEKRRQSVPFGVQGVPEGITEEIEGEEGHAHRGGGKDHEPPADFHRI